MIHKTFSCNLYLCIHHSYFLPLNDNIVDFEKTDGIFSLTFVVDDFSELFLHTSVYSFKDSRYA